jgi:benzoyl-CoA reductase subunit C
VEGARAWSLPRLHAGNVLPVEEHTALVRRYIAAATAVRQAHARQRPRRVIGSFCEQPPLGLIRTLEMAGCYIVWDDMALGKRWITGTSPPRGTRSLALAEAFIHHSTSTAVLYEPRREKGDALLDVVRRRAPRGVIFAAPSFCDPALLEQPILRTRSTRSAVPWTAFKYSENLGQFQVIREQAGTFADSIKLWSAT